jgi:transcriptional regulator with XRE-family HTH domain
MEYGSKIYKLRKQKSLSQEEVANELNVSRQSISLWETNQASPSMDNLIAIAKLFDVSLDNLVGLTTLNKDTEHTKDKPIYNTDYQEDKHVVYRRDYMYLNSKADAIMFTLSLFFFILAFLSFLSALNMEIQIAKIVLIIGFISTLLGLSIYPFYVYINIIKKTENHNIISIEFHNDYLTYKCANYIRETIQYDMMNYYIAKKDYFLLYFFKHKRIYVPKNSMKDMDEFFSHRAERRKNKKPFWK